jgi:hypothetical protein
MGQGWERQYLHELLCCVLFEEGWMPNWLQGVIDHQIGRWNYCTLGVGRIVCQIWRLGGESVIRISQPKCIMETYPIFFPEHKPS